MTPRPPTLDPRTPDPGPRNPTPGPRTADPSERLAWATYSAAGEGASGVNRDATVAAAQGEQGLFAVADGMGHLKGSENASRIAADRLTALFSRGLGEPRAFAERLSETGRAVCAAIREKIERGGGDRSMGTTLTGCAIFGGRYMVFHIGDSRLYHFSGGRLIRRTEDHTRQAEAERTGIRVPEGLPPHQLTRALMYADEKTTAIAFYPSDGGTFPLSPGDILVACTDGVHKHLTDTDFAIAFEHVADSASLGTALERLALRALTNGSTDDRSLTGVYLPGSGRGYLPVSRSEGDTQRRLPTGLWMALLGVIVGLIGLAIFLLSRPPAVVPTPTPTAEASPATISDASPSPAPSESPTPDPDAGENSGEDAPPVITPPNTRPSPAPTPTRRTGTTDEKPKRNGKPRGTGAGTRIDLPSMARIKRTIKSHLPKNVRVEVTIPPPIHSSAPRPAPRPKPSAKPALDDDPRRPKGQGINRPEPSKPEKADDDPRRPRRRD